MAPACVFISHLDGGKRSHLPAIQHEPPPFTLTTAFGGDARRTDLDRGADTPLFRFKIHSPPPSICPIFDTFYFPVSPYHEIFPVPPTKTQALMQNRLRASPRSPSNRVSPLSAPRLPRSRCGDTPISVQPPHFLPPSFPPP